MKALQKLYGFGTVDRIPPVGRLGVDLENQQTLYFLTEKDRSSRVH